MKLITVLFILLSGSCFGQIKGKAIAVHDGDTFTFQNDSCKITIRMAYIDAPELKQTFGKESGDYLRSKILNKNVTIIIHSLDKYGKRYVAEVIYRKKSVTENLVQNGIVWVYPEFCKIKAYYLDQDLAKAKKKGLWIDSNAIAPWIYRHNKF